MKYTTHPSSINIRYDNDEVFYIPNGKTITHHTYDNTIYKKTYYFVSDFDDDIKKKLYVYKFKNKEHFANRSILSTNISDLYEKTKIIITSYTPQKDLSEDTFAPTELTQFYSYYFVEPKDLNNKVSFIDSPQRESLMIELTNFRQDSSNNTFFLTGPPAIGKSFSLLYYVRYRTMKYIYLNLYTLYITDKMNV